MPTDTYSDERGNVIRNPQDAENLYWYLLHDENQKLLYQSWVPIWFHNFAMNIPVMKKTLNDLKSDFVRKSDSALVVAAGPSHKRIDYDLVRMFNESVGDVFCTNKSFRTLVRNGISPAVVCALDADPIMRKSFHFHHSGEAINGQRMCFASVVNHDTVKYVIKRGGVLYWVNPEMPGVDNATDIMGHMNGMSVIRHGGNAGGMMIWLAYMLGYKNIGVLGMDMGYKPSPDWDRGMAAAHEYFWIPWRRMTIALGFVFRIYLAEFSRMVSDIAYPTDEMQSVGLNKAYVQNLTEGSMLEISTLWPTRKLEEYVNDPDTTYEYFGGVNPRERSDRKETEPDLATESGK